MLNFITQLFAVPIEKKERVEFSREKLMKELAFDEGKRLTPYKDSLGWWTIGIGHLIKPGESLHRKISEEECIQLFLADIAIAEQTLTKVYPFWRHLDDVRQRALLNLTFNLGYKLKKFTRFLSAVSKQQWEQAGAALKDSKWWTQVGNRAPRIYQMIVKGNDGGYPQ